MSDLDAALKTIITATTHAMTRGKMMIYSIVRFPSAYQPLSLFVLRQKALPSSISAGIMQIMMMAITYISGNMSLDEAASPIAWPHSFSYPSIQRPTA